TIKHSPSAGGTTYPSRKQWVNAGSTISISETPATGYAFRRWNANTSLISLSSATSSTIIATINGAGSITAYFLATVSISLSPMSGTVTAGSSTSTNVTITGGSQSVSLSVSGLPSNATVSWAS